MAAAAPVDADAFRRLALGHAITKAGQPSGLSGFFIYRSDSGYFTEGASVYSGFKEWL